MKICYLGKKGACSVYFRAHYQAQSGHYIKQFDTRLVAGVH